MPSTQSKRPSSCRVPIACCPHGGGQLWRHQTLEPLCSGKVRTSDRCRSGARILKGSVRPPRGQRLQKERHERLYARSQLPQQISGQSLIECLVCMPVLILLLGMGLKAMHWGFSHLARSEILYECAICLSEQRNTKACEKETQNKLKILTAKNKRLNLVIEERKWICAIESTKHKVSSEHLRRASL